jgi:hypothetical protein
MSEQTVQRAIAWLGRTTITALIVIGILILVFGLVPGSEVSVAALAVLASIASAAVGGIAGLVNPVRQPPAGQESDQTPPAAGQGPPAGQVPPPAGGDNDSNEREGGTSRWWRQRFGRQRFE